MFVVECELVAGDVFFMKRDGVVVQFDNLEEADAVAERMWGMKSGGGLYARFSVVDDENVRVTDWECD